MHIQYVMVVFDHLACTSPMFIYYHFKMCHFILVFIKNYSHILQEQLWPNFRLNLCCAEAFQNVEKLRSDTSEQQDYLRSFWRSDPSLTQGSLRSDVRMLCMGMKGCRNEIKPLLRVLECKQPGHAGLSLFVRSQVSVQTLLSIALACVQERTVLKHLIFQNTIFSLWCILILCDVCIQHRIGVKHAKLKLVRSLFISRSIWCIFFISGSWTQLRYETVFDVFVCV